MAFYKKPPIEKIIGIGFLTIQLCVLCGFILPRRAPRKTPRTLGF